MSSSPNPLISTLNVDETSSVLQLRQAFQLLDQQTDLEKAVVEKQKLDIIRFFEKIIENDISQKYPVLLDKKNKNEDENLNTGLDIFQYIKELGRQGLYYFMFAFGLFQSVGGSYLFGESLFSLIPGIANPILFAASIVFTILSSVLFYAFEVTFLKVALGISYSSTDFMLLVETYSEQLKTTIAINKLLTSKQMIEINGLMYADYIQFAKLLNQDLRTKHDAMGTYPESILQSILKTGLLTFGAISSIASSYFFTSSLLAVLAAPLASTPVGWAIIALTIVAGLGYYYAMDIPSVISLVNPAFESFKSLKEDLALFKNEYHNDRFFEKKQTQDSSTQTEQIYSVLNQARLSVFNSYGAAGAGLQKHGGYELESLSRVL